MLVIQVLLGLIPLLGIVWIFVTGTLATVDGLFMSLILLTISGVLMLMPMLELRARVLKSREDRKKSVAPAEQKVTAKTSAAAQSQKASESPQPQKTTS